MSAFGIRELQLVLLRRMADHHPDLVLDAQRQLGATPSQAREANRRWNASLHVRGSGGVRHARMRRELGPPAVEGVPVSSRAIAGLAMTRSAWPLTIWPDLWFETLSDDVGTVWHLGLTRADGAPHPVLRSVADLTPWSCTIPELSAAIAPVTYHDDGVTGRQPVIFTASDGAGRPTRWLATFVWGLLQTVVPETA